MAGEVTTETVHPRIIEASAQLQKRLLALALEPDEIILTARIVVRNGVPRKVKWQHETEECYT